MQQTSANERVARDEDAFDDAASSVLSDMELLASPHLILSTGPEYVNDAQQNTTSQQGESSYLDALLLLDDDITPVATPQRGVLHESAESADLALLSVMAGPTTDATTVFVQAIDIPHGSNASSDVGASSCVKDNLLDSNVSGRSLGGDTSAAIFTSESASTSENAGKPKRKHNNTTRKRQKQELEYLRVKVEELEHELQVLRSRADGSAPFQSPVSTVSTTSSEGNGTEYSEERTVPLELEAPASSQSLWKRVARNQMEGKQRAEIENARLREMVVNQLKIVSGLEKILSKRINEPEDSFSEERKRLRISDESEASIFERLAKDLDQRYTETDQVFRENGFATSKIELQHAQMKVDALNGMHMEFLDSKVLPFAMQTTQDALWRSLARENLRLTDGHYAVVDRTDDFLTAKLAINLRHKRLQAQVDVKFVAKRFLQEDRAVVIWACQSDAEGPMCGSGGIQLIDSGWTVIEPLARVDGMLASIIQSCARVVPEFAESAAEEDQPVGLLTDLVTGSFLRNMSAFHQSAEDLLVEEALRDGMR